MILNDTQILKQLKQGRSKIINYLFDLYYVDLCKYAFKLTEKKEIAEEIVQDIFIYLWEKRDTINIESSVKNYIFRAVKNKSLNYFKSKYAKISFQENLADKDHPVINDTDSSILYNELSKITKMAIDALPERCALIFRLSRNFNMTYKEIAKNLNISVKTVENQIIKALKRIRKHLDENINKT